MKNPTTNRIPVAREYQPYLSHRGRVYRDPADLQQLLDELGGLP
jgi:hypothetical protein